MTEATYTIAQIASVLEADAFGDVDLVISRLSEPQNAGPDDLALASNESYAKHLSQGNARAALVWSDADWQGFGLRAAIVPRRPRYAMAGLTRMMDPGQGFGQGIHGTAVIDPTAVIGENVSIGAFTVVAAGAKIGRDSVIGPHCYVGWNAKIGSQAYFRENVSVGARVTIGERSICQPGVRLGGDGFSFATADRSAVEAARATLGDQQDTEAQAWMRIHSLGSVKLGDDIEIGTNTAIDCGTIRDTRIGDRTKIDNLVHIGHNCVIGMDCLICGQVGLAGSVTIGNNVVLAGQVGVGDNLSIGDRVIAGGASKIMTSVPAGRTVLGYPATKMETNISSYKALRRLPRVMKDIKALQNAVFKSDADG
ncbi:MAG: UDP-3-O-(3-hydroxymyristoyl)glucosamine N-acyltransferase [Pseudomonadota bacterium]